MNYYSVPLSKLEDLYQESIRNTETLEQAYINRLQNDINKLKGKISLNENEKLGKSRVSRIEQREEIVRFLSEHSGHEYSTGQLLKHINDKHKLNLRHSFIWEVGKALVRQGKISLRQEGDNQKPRCFWSVAVKKYND